MNHPVDASFKITYHGVELDFGPKGTFLIPWDFIDEQREICKRQREDQDQSAADYERGYNIEE